MNFAELGFSDGEEGSSYHSLSCAIIGYQSSSFGCPGIRYSGKDDVIDKYPQPHEPYGYMLRNNTVTLENGTLVG
jgi:hypothetical protein